MTPADSTVGTCSVCGEVYPEPVQRCAVCGAGQLVDVVVDETPEEKQLYRVARAVGALGPPGPDFAGARQRLTRPGSVLVGGATHGLAHRLRQLLEAEGVTYHVQPHEEDDRRFGPAALMATLFVMAAGCLVAFGVHERARARRLDTESAELTAKVEAARSAAAERERSRVAEVASMPPTVGVAAYDAMAAAWRVAQEEQRRRQLDGVAATERSDAAAKAKVMTEADERRIEALERRREEAWRSAFNAARQDIRAWEERVQRAREKTRQYESLTRPASLSEAREYRYARDELASAERALEQARSALVSLEGRAANDAIPLDWRR